MYDKTELIHLFISVITISLAFALPLRVDFPLVLLTVGLAFVIHETAHKIVANAFGCKTMYRAWLWGLVLAVFLGIATQGRFIFAAPGAVYIFKDYLTRKENGIISIAGAFSNFMLGLLFLYIFMTASAASGLVLLAWWGFRVNMFIGFFNMIPIPPLDGSKVFGWNIFIWGAFFAVLAYFTFILPMSF